jgi:hypothetical protein
VLAIPDAEKTRLREALVDCCLATVQLSDLYSINLSTAVNNRLMTTEARNPAVEAVGVQQLHK